MTSDTEIQEGAANPHPLQFQHQTPSGTDWSIFKKEDESFYAVPTSKDSPLSNFELTATDQVEIMAELDAAYPKLTEPEQVSWVRAPNDITHTTPDGHVWELWQSDPGQTVKATSETLGAEYVDTEFENTEAFFGWLDKQYPALFHLVHTTPDGKVWDVTEIVSEEDEVPNYLEAYYDDGTPDGNDDITIKLDVAMAEDHIKARLDAEYPLINPATNENDLAQLDRGSDNLVKEEAPPVVEEVTEGVIVHLVWDSARKIAHSICQWCNNHGWKHEQHDYDKFFKLSHDGKSEMPELPDFIKEHVQAPAEA